MEENSINDIIMDISVSCHLKYIARRIKPPGLFFHNKEQQVIDYIIRPSIFIKYKHNLYIPNKYKGYKIRLVNIER